MKLSELKKAPNSTRTRKRKGKGQASGLGKTAGRGMNGQNARSGGGVRLGFEGGQMPLYRRIPKRGFTNIWKKEYQIVNLADLNRLEDGTDVTPESLWEMGFIKKQDMDVKILADGEFNKKLNVKANKFSKVAVEKLEAAGGKAEVI